MAPKRHLSVTEAQAPAQRRPSPATHDEERFQIRYPTDWSSDSRAASVVDPPPSHQYIKPEAEEEEDLEIPDSLLAGALQNANRGQGDNIAQNHPVADPSLHTPSQEASQLAESIETTHEPLTISFSGPTQVEDHSHGYEEEDKVLQDDELLRDDNDSDDEEEEEQVEDLDKLEDETAEYVLDMLTMRDFGCGQEKHAQEHTYHQEASDHDDHHPLSATHELDGRWVPGKVAARSIGLHLDAFPQANTASRRWFPDGDKIRSVMEGWDQRLDMTRQVCLHTEQVSGSQAEMEFDIDSLIAFPQSLGAFKRGIDFCFQKLLTYNIDADLHVTCSIPYSAKTGRTATRVEHPRHIPHLYLGNLQEFRNSTVLIFFPWLIRSDRASSWLTDEEACKFFDKILLPACRSFMTSGTKQHFPPNSQTESDKSRAKGTEQRSTRYERGLRQVVLHPIESTHFDRIWRSVQQIIDTTPGLKMFRDAFFMVNLKNFKADTKAAQVDTSVNRFKKRLETVFDMSRVEYYADAGVEIYPSQPGDASLLHQNANRGRHADNSDGEEAFDSDDSMEDLPQEPPLEHLVYLWKTCCLQTQLKRLQDWPFDTKRGKADFYHTAMLRDTGCMTVEPPAKSWIRRGGWVYGQWYASVKEIQDAQKVYPFDHDYLVNLALDPGIHAATVHGPARTTLEGSYVASKKRVYQAYKSYSATSFGVRLEFRVIGRVLDKMGQKAAQRRAYSIPKDPDFVWAVATKDWNKFMRGNYEKITTLIEMVIKCSPVAGISLPSSRLIFSLLTYLQNFANCKPHRSGLLWVDTRMVDDKPQRGFGLSRTVEEYGFGWVLPIVDWELLLFQDGVGPQLIGMQEVVGKHYRESARLFQDTKAQMEVCLELIPASGKGSFLRKKVLTVLAHLVLRQYRRDVLDALNKAGDLRTQLNSDAAKDKVKFSDRGWSDIVVEKPLWLVQSGRTRARKPEELFEWLMGFSDSWKPNRVHMDGDDSSEGYRRPKEFRRLLKLVQDHVYVNDDLQKAWTSTLMFNYRKYMWVIPYPDTKGTFISTNHGNHKQGPPRRVFYSHIEQRGKTGNIWIWGKDEVKQGYPPDYPRALNMSTEELREYFQQCKLRRR